MNFLEQLHNKINESDWDVKDDEVINKAFLEVNNKLHAAGENQLLTQSEREREVFNFHKSPVKKLQWKSQGTNTYKDGRVEPFEWPDIKTWGEEDYNYIKSRYGAIKNQFARSEYGLMLFYKGKLQVEECRNLFEDLFSLAQRYYKANYGKEKGPYRVWDFYNALHNAIYIAYHKRQAPGFMELLIRGFRYVEEIHKEWDKAGKYLLRTTIDMTGLLLSYFDEGSKIVAVEGFIERNSQAAEAQSKTYTWGAIYIIDENIKLAASAKMDTTQFLQRKAELYEKLYEEAKDTRLMAGITFLEKAMKLYSDINHTDKVIELEALYQKIRHEPRMGEVRQEMPEEYNVKILEFNQQRIKDNDESGIVKLLCLADMFHGDEYVQKMVEDAKSQSLLLNMMATSIIDKSGNTTDAFVDEKQREEFMFWHLYTFQFQLGVQTLQAFFLEAYRAGKISYMGVSQFIESSWIGNKNQRLYNGVLRDFCLADTVLPGIREFFRQLDKWRDSDEQPEFVTVIDSLSLKIEKIMREFCLLAGISIFKRMPRQSGKVEIKNEKNIDDLLRDLKTVDTGFSQNDITFIEYVLTEKAGQNLRHKVAHGLLDYEEYVLHYALLCIVIILKIGSYEMVSSPNADGGTTSS